MKRSMIPMITAPFVVFAMMSTSCNSGNNGTASSADSVCAPPASSKYVDLKTGKPVKKDTTTGKYVDEAGTPIIFFVDVAAKDTIYAPSGQNVNNSLLNDNGEWRVDETKIQIDTVHDTIVSQQETNTGKTKVKKDETKIKGSKSNKEKIKQ